MCALRTPFQADDLDALKDKIQKEKYPPLPNNVHKFFLGIISKLLQKRPEQRPSIEDIIMLDEF